MPGTHVLCGLRVASELPLPELLPWPGPADAPVDVEIRARPVREASAGPAMAGGLVSVGPDRSILLAVPGLVRILVRDGRTVDVEILAHDSTESWRLFLLGSSLHHLCLARGLAPLHAACLKVHGRVVALAGQSGAGKSSLALALVRRGHQLVSDDHTVVRSTSAGGVEVLPAYPRLKAWADTLQALDLPAAGLPRVRPTIDKYDLRPAGPFDPAPIRLDTALILATGETPAVRRLAPAEAISQLSQHVGRPQLVAQLGLRPALFAQMAVLCRSVEVLRLERPRRLDLLDATAALVEAHCAG